MARLEYKSLVTKETINYYLSIIKDEREKKDFTNTISKFDIRISTKPVIEGEEFYYKIWILRRGTKNKAHIKDYYSLELLKEEFQSPITLAEILEMVRINADVPDDFEEYCEMCFEALSDKICRIDYLDNFKESRKIQEIYNPRGDKILSFYN